MKEKNLFGVLGSALGIVGTSLQTEDILRIISLVITIVGGIITWIVIPILNWYNKSKADGHIDKEEVKELTETIKEGSSKIEQELRKENEQNESKD